MAVNLYTSTNYDPEYSRNNVLDNVLDSSGQSYTPEFFSIKYKRLINNIKSVGVGNLTAQPLPTTAYKYYNNTTCWWMFALINGFGNPLAVPPQTVVSIPDIDVISRINDVSPTINLNQSNVTI